MSNELFGEVVKTISLDFAQKTSPVTVFAKQGDNRTRISHIQPLMNGVPMNIDTSFQYVAKFAAKKPDGHYVYNDSAKINDDGTITVTLTDQTLAAHGNATCCIMLETQSGDVMTSQNFTLIIEFSAGAYKNLASSDEILGLDEKLAQVQELIDKLDAEIKVLPPITPADKDKVLTANEDGTAGWKDPKGNANFIFANSKEELPDPSTVPENTVGLVPSEGAGGGGLPVVELTTAITPEGGALTESENATINAIGRNMFLMSVTFELGGDNPTLLMYIVMTPMWIEGVEVAGYVGVTSFLGMDTAHICVTVGEDMTSWSYTFSLGGANG